jgi:hypothetical protein
MGAARVTWATVPPGNKRFGREDKSDYQEEK